MARTFWIFATVLMLSAVSGAVSQLDNALSLYNVSVSPNPIVAGGTATIRFQLYDSYGSFVQTVNLQASGSYPITNVSPAKSTDIANVNPGVNPQYYSYTFAVPPFTPSGTYKVYFNASYYGLGATVVVASSSMPVSFYVKNKPEIEATASSSATAALYSGYNQTIDLVIQNVGYGAARNVNVTVSGERGLSILSPVTHFLIGSLTAGSSVSEPLLVSAQGTGNPGLAVSMTYSSADLVQSFSGAQNVSIAVAPSAQFEISSQVSSIPVGVSDKPVRFTITNTGTSEAKQVLLSLQTSYPVTLVTGTTYIADLPVGASENVTFFVSSDPTGTPGTYPVILYEQWKQPNGAVNQQFSGSNSYFVTVGSGGSGASALEAAAAFVILLLAAYFFYLYRGRIVKRLKK